MQYLDTVMAVYACCSNLQLTARLPSRTETVMFYFEPTEISKTGYNDSSPETCVINYIDLQPEDMLFAAPTAR
jgi:hypothetical protein